MEIMKIIKTILKDLKENLIENIPMRTFLMANLVTMTVGFFVLTLLKMIPEEISRPIMVFGMLGIAFLMFCAYFWGKRHPDGKRETKKWIMNETMAIICGILGGLVFIFGFLLGVK